MALESLPGMKWEERKYSEFHSDHMLYRHGEYIGLVCVTPRRIGLFSKLLGFLSKQDRELFLTDAKRRMERRAAGLPDEEIVKKT